jgi:hypothetical protein
MSAFSLTLFPRASLLAALWLMSGAAIAGTTVYKWVDEKGVTHYSDQPNPKAQKVEVQGAQSYGGGDTVSSSGPTSAPSEPAAAYYRCELSRPTPEENFQNTSTITAQVRLEPALQQGHQVILTLDGKRLTDQSTYTTDFVITELVRGAHNLSAVVLNGGGQRVCTTPSVTFHVHLPSVQSPVRARPRR